MPNGRRPADDHNRRTSPPPRPMKRLLLPALLGLALAAQAADETPLDALPYTPGLDVTAMDRSADPCDDLYRYACGAWTQANPIPADQSRWSVYAKMANENQRYLWGVLAKLGDAAAERSPAQAKLGDYFASCMDEGAVQAAGLKGLQPLLDRIAGLRHQRDLPGLLAELQLAAGGDRLFFSFSAGQDFADATRQIAFAHAGGLGLPDRDYYLKRDAKTLKIRNAYETHVAHVFTLLGESPAAAKAAARSVLATETVLAKASLSKVDKRDPYKTFHVVDARGLKALMPGFDWASYQAALGAAPWYARYNVTEPAFFKALGARLQAMSAADLQTYLRWQLASSLSPALDNAFVQANFDFYGQTLTGTPQLKARWKRCVQLVDLQLGEALGQEFVARNFTPEIKAATVQMTHEIEAAMARSIDSLTWMSAATKARAHAKLKTIVNKVGYSERWRDYSAFAVQRGDFLGNVVRGNVFEARRQLAKIGQPLDRGEWSMTPQTVNAYYDAQMNDINFPAGVLQPPLYDPKMDAAPNYGNTGGTIGHELTHGFDDEGRQFDAQGNLKSWWTPKDGREFEKRAACVADQYATYTVVDEIKINSKLTLGEDLADLGGLVLAWEAWKAHMVGKPAEARDGLTPEQRFFVGFAQWDCAAARPEHLRVQAKIDPHSPPRWRINGVVVNMPEFEKAFACKPGAKLVKPAGQHCKVW
jgi:putative endopeptidase